MLESMETRMGQRAFVDALSERFIDTINEIDCIVGTSCVCCDGWEKLQHVQQHVWREKPVKDYACVESDCMRRFGFDDRNVAFEFWCQLIETEQVTELGGHGVDPDVNHAFQEQIRIRPLCYWLGTRE
jgi:hypothetical protein